MAKNNIIKILKEMKSSSDDTKIAYKLNRIRRTLGLKKQSEVVRYCVTYVFRQMEKEEIIK